ncbi:nonsense-mediated mRNA decay factor SMG8 [Cydia strobilella]|uniref:nonsense-mediated mRNA decay factor SMG8 n=1 Tax=Cydia strobilella TaxID=1100964 RepID=UPI003005BBC0
MKNFSLADIPEFSKKERIVVVGIIGKSPYRYPNKTTPLFSSSATEENGIQCQWDERHNTLFLHAITYLDTKQLATLTASLNENSNSTEKDADASHWLVAAGELTAEACKAMALMFHLCHIVVLSSPTPVFDLGYLQLFKAIDAYRTELAPRTSAAVSFLGGAWEAHGRSCCPRLLFHFRRAPRALARNPAGLKRLEHAVEDQLYFILRKARIITNVCAKSLFAIPKNEEFVYMSAEEAPCARDVSALVRGLVRRCAGVEPIDNRPERGGLRQFIQGHVDLAFGEGFDDNVGKYAMSTSFFELPAASTWRSAAQALAPLYLESPAAEGGALHDSLATDVRFSHARCAKVLPIAQASYAEGLPAHYSSQHHAHKVSVALGVLHTMARGPVAGAAEARLRAACTAAWRSRSLCEAPSLTAHPCIHPEHDNSKEHSSGVRYISACNCGRSKCSRDDPYTVKAANCTFYTTAAVECGVCSTLTSVAFPVFTPSTPTYRYSYSMCSRDDPYTVKAANCTFYTTAAVECGVCSTLTSVAFPVFTPSTPTYRYSYSMCSRDDPYTVKAANCTFYTTAAVECGVCSTLTSVAFPVFTPSTPTYRYSYSMCSRDDPYTVKAANCTFYTTAAVESGVCSTLTSVAFPVFTPSTPTYRYSYSMCSRDDPYTVKAANCTFYTTAAVECGVCSTLTSVAFPVFTPSTPTYRYSYSMCSRDDPYTVKAANCTFYTTAAVECGVCSTLTSVAFPVFTPSTPTYRYSYSMCSRDDPYTVKAANCTFYTTVAVEYSYSMCSRDDPYTVKAANCTFYTTAAVESGVCSTLTSVAFPVFTPSTPTYRYSYSKCSRDDPYTVKAANCTFYTTAAVECGVCSTLTSVAFPVFTPSTPTYRYSYSMCSRDDPYTVKAANCTFYTTAAVESGVCSTLTSVAFPVFTPSTPTYRYSYSKCSRDDPYTVKAANCTFYTTAAVECGVCSTLTSVAFPVFTPSTPTYRYSYSMCSRDDPYTVKAANCTFYTTAAVECGVCSTLTSVAFPVFTPSTPTYRAASVKAGSQEAELEPRASDGNSGCSGWSAGDALSPGSGEEESGPQYLVPARDNEKVITRQPSTTEYLPGMLHTASPQGLLPAFSSWSLVCLGASSLYSHSLGLPEHLQPGLLPHTNYLLPWDARVRMEQVSAWRAAQASARGRGKATAPHHLTVKIFLGFEYECPRGHRFMMSSPDTVVNGGGGACGRDAGAAGARLAASDMPLYSPCLCRGTNTMLAQLMRVHVVTPKAPVHVTLDPKVQPVTGGPIFVPEPAGSEPIELSGSAYWVLRLPYIYADERGPLPRPRQASGLLLAPLLGLRE